MLRSPLVGRVRPLQTWVECSKRMKQDCKEVSTAEACHPAADVDFSMSHAIKHKPAGVRGKRAKD